LIVSKVFRKNEEREEAFPPPPLPFLRGNLFLPKWVGTGLLPTDLFLLLEMYRSIGPFLPFPLFSSFSHLLGDATVEIRGIEVKRPQSENWSY